ncbi:RagB/SusD family nutrient uptake outer membrane protein [Prolixibacteraceae bacterium]|nr:RagB/SusD family nutrient uptake outer membrane protein [Prolixibacteraceae bacterium]
MKRIYIITLLIATALFSSCDSFLDITPVGQVRPTTVKDYRALLTRAYITYSNTYSLTNYRTDNTKFLGGDTGGPYVEHFFWNENNGDGATSIYSYADLYHIIFICNQIITAESEMINVDKEVKAQLISEAHALRAFSYYELVTTFADSYNPATAATTLAIPVNLDATISLDANIGKSTIEVVYQQIQSDINKALELSNVDKEVEQAFTYRFSKVAIHALNAQLALVMGEWKVVVASANEVLKIQSELQDLNVGTDDFLTSNSVENIIALRQVITSSLQNGTFAISDELSQLVAEDNNLRKGNMFRSNGEPIINDNSKCKVGFRVPEVMLMLAEASMRLDAPDAATAKTELKKIVAVRYTPEVAADINVKIDAMDNAALLKEVLRQRRIELAFQGKRWVDLKRLGKPSFTHEYTNKAGQIRIETLIENDPRYVVKFPLDAIRLNPNLNK